MNEDKNYYLLLIGGIGCITMSVMLITYLTYCSPNSKIGVVVGGGNLEKYCEMDPTKEMMNEVGSIVGAVTSGKEDLETISK